MLIFLLDICFATKSACLDFITAVSFSGDIIVRTKILNTKKEMARTCSITSE